MKYENYKGVEIYLFECSGVVPAMLIYFACFDHKLFFATFHMVFVDDFSFHFFRLSTISLWSI